MRRLLIGLGALFLSGCMGMPRDITPVQGFNLDRYLGTWYEIARLDHSFERGLDNVSAHYGLRDDGGITVTNRGYSQKTKTWSEAKGKAYFAGESDIGHLEVSFFGPFYSSYVIFELDREDYKYAFVSGYNTSYLWLLARSPVVDEEVMARFIEKAGAAGFATDQLIRVHHEGARPDE